MLMKKLCFIILSLLLKIVNRLISMDLSSKCKNQVWMPHLTMLDWWISGIKDGSLIMKWVRIHPNVWIMMLWKSKLSVLGPDPSQLMPLNSIQLSLYMQQKIHKYALVCQNLLELINLVKFWQSKIPPFLTAVKLLTKLYFIAYSAHSQHCWSSFLESVFGSMPTSAVDQRKTRVIRDHQGIAGKVTRVQTFALSQIVRDVVEETTMLGQSTHLLTRLLWTVW